MTTYNIYLFDCPVHGTEETALCWRALENEYRHLWQKHLVTSSQIELPEDELEKMLKKIKQALIGVGGFYAGHELVKKALHKENQSSPKRTG